MRRYSLLLMAVVLATLLMVGLTWAEETKSCQKSTTGTAEAGDQKLAIEKACVKAEGLSSVDAKHHGAGEGSCQSNHGGHVEEGCHGHSGNHSSEGCHGSGGCHSSEGCHGSSGCHGSEGCHGSGGCHAMMAGGAGHGCAGMHRGMMDRGGRSGRRFRGPVPPGVPRSGGPDHFIRMAEHLELTDQQIAEFKALRRDHEKAAIEMRAEIALARVDMKELLDEETVNFGKIKTKVAQIADMHKKIRLARWTRMEKSHDLLTAEQREKAQSLRRRGAGLMREGRRQMIRKMIIEETEE